MFFTAFDLCTRFSRLPTLYRYLAPFVGDTLAGEEGLFVSDQALVYSRGSLL